MAWVEKNGKYYRVRYYADDGTIGSLSDRYSKEQAEEVAENVNVDQRRGEFLDPRHGDLLLNEWAEEWFEALDVAPYTEAQYRSSYRNHIAPQWGESPIGDISTMAVRAWEKRLRRTHPPTMVDTILKPLRMMLEDAVEERLIPTNPARARKRGKRVRRSDNEKVWATPTQALAVANNAGVHVGPWARTLILTAAWTGMRWGELAGLQWSNVHLLAEQPYLYVHPMWGSLHELGGECWLDAPKSEAGGRCVTLPPFLVDELALHQSRQQGYDAVFTAPDGGWLRRSNYGRRVMRPMCDGREESPARRGHPARPAVTAAAPGLTMHGFKHGHNTWMIGQGVPDVARYRRLGWRISDAVQRTYSHVSEEVEQRLLDGLEARYQEAVAEVERAGTDGSVPYVAPTDHEKAPSRESEKGL